MTVRPPTRLAALLAVVGAVVAACGGERPSLSPVPELMGGPVGSPVGDAGVDAVLALLEGTEGVDGPFTARYQVTRKLGPNTTDATVVRSDGTTSVTVGDIRFFDADRDLTCRLSTETCENGILDARISDYSVGSAFWGTGPARALRVAYTRRSGEPSPSSLEVGGRPATCVDVPVGPGVERYCASDLGPVALWDTAGLEVRLTSLQDAADGAALTPPGA